MMNEIMNLSIKPTNFIRAKVRLVGDTPLIVHARFLKRNEIGNYFFYKNPYAMFINSLYWITTQPEPIPEEFFSAVSNGAKFGFPVDQIYASVKEASKYCDLGMSHTAFVTSFCIETDYSHFFEIKGSVPQMRADMIVKNNIPNILYRAEFDNWFTEFYVCYLSSGKITLEKILHCMNKAGKDFGIGGKKGSGEFGTFHVEEVSA